MKAITIKQPWASLIVTPDPDNFGFGIKPIENRTWPCPKKYIGERVLIHAGLSVDESSIDKISLINGELARKTWFDINDDKLPLGAIIGSVEIVDCVTNHSSIWAENSETNCSEKCRLIDCEYFIDWNCGEGWCASCKLIGQSYEVDDIPKECPHKMKIDRIYNWVLANPIKFPEPIPAKGKLSFWDFDM